jgi:hypothetical protein
MYVFLLKPASPNILIKKEISIQLWKGVGGVRVSTQYSPVGAISPG